MPDVASRNRRDSVGAQTGLLYDSDGRLRKAAKIRAALAMVVGDTSALSLLDVGCASGIITRDLSTGFKCAVGIDLNEEGLRMDSRSGHQQAGTATLLRATTATLPFADTSFDVIVCAQVYEHVADQTALAEETFRVLKPGGWLFFSGPNRAWPIEDHYKLFGLGWIPRSWANFYLRLAGRGEVFEENLLTTRQLQKLFWRYERVDLTVKMIKNPSVFHFEASPALALAGRLPEMVLRRLGWIYPNPNWLLRKRRAGEI